MYPSLYAFATEAKEQLVATEFGPQALGQREALKEQLQQTVDEIDAQPSLAQFVAGSQTGSPAADRAFLAFVIWSRTPLATYRLKSAVELYHPDGRLLSRFALNLPDYETTPYRPVGCTWDSLEEASPFGSSERHVLRASRGLCDSNRRPIAGIVVRAMLDPQDLPFISSQSPYLEALRPTRRTQAEAVSGRDVEFAMYGWSRGPIYALGTEVWTLADSVFQRCVESRAPFWTTIERNGTDYRVYILNDRGGIYALGYPTVTWTGHLITLAELMMLAFVLYALLVAGATLFSVMMLRAPESGRALLREIRSSFYHKLFLFFVAAAVVPVLILAIVTRNYFLAQVLAGAEESAARTVTTAQRLVEDYATSAAARHVGSRDDRRPDHDSRPPRGGRRRQPLRSHTPAGDQRARLVRVSSCFRCARRARSTGTSCWIACRRWSATKKWASFPISLRRRRSAAAGARRS